MFAKENEIDRRRFFLRHTRPSKFGTQLQINRADGSRCMVNNIYQKSIDSTNLGKKQRQKSNAVMGKNNKLNKIVTNELLVNEATLEESDRNLLKIMKDYVNDMLDNTYNPLINEVFAQIQQGSLQDAADFDNYHFFKFSSFMI